ncbi:MAG: hypothetical protein U1F36_19730 [Planctomycetota bacterium]
MQGPRSAALALLLVVSCFAQEAVQISTPGCAVCHPGAPEGLRTSRHATFLEKYAGDSACTLCHGAAAEHIASAKRPEAQLVHVGAVGANACAACHDHPEWPTTLGRHDWHAGSTNGVGTPSPIDPDDVLPPARGLVDFEWQGLALLGQRFVSRTGSRGRYETDVDLDPGLRLVDFALDGDGHSALIDHVGVHARDLGDPWSRVSAEIAKEDRYRLDIAREDRVFHMRARGDYSRVSHAEQSDSADLELDLGHDLSLFGSFEHFEDDGHWLTQRLAGRGTTPLVPVVNVDSPRTLDSNQYTAGLRFRSDDLHALIAYDHLDEIEVDRWSFDRPAPTNPLLRESEDERSHGHTHGPGVRVSVEQDFGAVRVALRARHRELERDTETAGLLTGVDPVAFVTRSAASTRGDAALSTAGATLTAEIGDHLSASADIDWRHHDEHQRLDAVEVTDFPGTGGSSTLIEQLDQRTRSERWDGSLSLDADPVDDLLLTLGVGFSREELVLPALPSGGLDPSRGTIRDAGVLGEVRFSPDREWSFDARFQDFGQTGLLLEEQQERNAHEWRASVRRHTDTLTTELGWRRQLAHNDASLYHLHRDTLNLSGHLDATRSLGLLASWVFTDSDSSTLTSFYFDPDPTPVPTLVGFKGRSHTLSTGIDLHDEQRLDWHTELSWTTTSGSADLDTLDFRTDLRVELIEGGSIGARYQHVEYREEGGVDDFGADLLLLYWRQQIGAARR